MTQKAWSFNKSTELLLIMLYEEVFIFESLWIKSIEVKATERHFAVVLFIILVQGDSNF